LGIHYLSGSITYDPATSAIDPNLASKIVWLDCLLTNVDRTAKNTNMLMWYHELWLIDFGASLYFHHSWNNWKAQAEKPFVLVKDHVLLPQASELDLINNEFKKIFSKEIISNIVDAVPEEWIKDESSFDSVAHTRQAYKDFLNIRIAHSETFVNEAKHARESII
jgi:hypothetical protein